MLVLSRKLGETIQIGDAIAVTVVRISVHEVRLGIEAPAGSLVARRELTVEPRPTPVEPEPPRGQT